MGLKLTLTLGVTLLKSLAWVLMICKWSKYFLRRPHMTAVFPRLLLYNDWEPRHEQLITTYRGPEGSLTLIIVVLKAHRWWLYELIHSLTSSHSLLVQPLSSVSTSQSFCPTVTISPPRLSIGTFSSTNHIEMPTLTFRFDPTNHIICSHMRHLLPQARGGDN